MIAWANLRERWPSFVATFLAVVVGTGLVGATLLVQDSAQPDVQPRLRSTAVLAVAPEAGTNRSFYPGGSVPWSPTEADALVRDLAAVPGVAAAVPDRSFYAQAFPDGRPAGDPDDDEAGHGWSSLALGPYRLVDGAGPRAPGEVVVDSALGVDVGAPLTVHLATGPQTYRVTGTVDGPGLYVSDAEARVREPGVRAIGILAAPGADVTRGTSAVVEGRGSLLIGSQRAVVEPGWVAHQRFLGTQVIAAMALVAVFTTVFVVATTLTLGIAGRRRELGLLRAIGAEPRRVRRMVLGEAAGIGLAGGVVGAVAACALAPVLVEVLEGLGAAPTGLALRITPGPLVVAVVLGVAVSVAGAWGASRTAARTLPSDALRDATAEHRPMTRGRLIGAAAALGVGVVLVVAAALTGSDARVGLGLGAGAALVVAATAFAPLVIGPLVGVRAFGRGFASAVPMLVRAEVRAAGRRSAATAAPVIAAVGAAVLLTGMVDTMAVAYPAEQTRQLAGQTLIDADGAPGLGDDVLREVGAPPGTRAPLPTQVFVPGSGAPSDTTVVDAIGTLDRALVAPGEAVLSEPMAAALGARAGSTLPVRFVDGETASLQVRAVLPVDPTRGDLAVARDTVRSHDPSALTDAVFVPSDRAPAAVGPGATVRDAQSYALADYETDARLTDGLVALLVAMSVGYSGLAVANGTATAAHGRRRDLAVLRTAGATRAQLVRIALAETGAVVVVGILLGLLVTIPPLVGVASGLSEATGTRVTLQLDPTTLSATALGCLGLALVSTFVVTCRTTRAV
ncbi:putative ABC transport system permease protein [Pseudonocardia sediminis]|uniref:Putative ABC transport system permease protein n=1 Tax=Pseudonocardia sediminis TaxID=1397368 RepID=A0A4Q7UZ47_PSEST|nr:ABC transporter permease [Pseudonocardia sediminis]RZT86281.1 putative ABC transport system permease protein [Pseudonocardia sediminis]